MRILYKKLYFLMVCVSICTFAQAESKKKTYTPSDYPNFPKETWEYFTGLLPKVLLTHLQVKYNASYITACKGNYVNKDADEYVVGFIYGAKNLAYSMVFSIDQKTNNISSTVVKEYTNIAEGITSHYVPAVEVYCEKGFIASKTQINGLPAFTYDKKSKSFVYSSEHSVFEP